ncbi:hypothetical protein ANME2D_02515 [Candidatus Methanoperedens nitroreducens]|uniref:Uncharacterized protein n=1 Tax=Candidatus Methanoperedens nitratireducens TaxID=1392998 RepID=A0A062V535_9EURY|nr:hypothetical protein [Candidatus Methanoperedens nitroreducens]KCZ70495.1 hypothetical protein ANME2D_02515 [Candidatus Methanoperedens nitroreducens]MDJ1420346.1 hypothetical protein [Candidatus Methanoperedens sp.]
MDKKGLYSMIASLATSSILVILFYVLALQKMQENVIFTSVDVYGGMVFVFILSMIVSASIWPGIVEKALTK